MKLPLTLLSILFLQTFRSSAYAQSNSNDLDLFCSDPQKYICGYSNNEFAQYSKDFPATTLRDQYKLSETFKSKIKKQPIDLVLESFSKKSLRLMAAEIGIKAPDYTLQEFYNYLNKSTSPKKEKLRLVLKYAKSWITQANAYVYNETGEIPKGRKIMKDDLAKAKSAVSAFVQVRTDLFPSALQEKIIQNLKNIPLYTVYDFEENHEMVLDPNTEVYEFKNNPAQTVNPKAEKWLGAFLESCATPDTTGVFNAFYINDGSKTNNAEAVVICPGFMEKAILEQHFQIESGIFFVLAHELGHSIQSYLNWVPLLACVDQNIDESELRESSFANKPSIWTKIKTNYLSSPAEKEKAKLNRRLGIIVNYGGEMVADQLGLITLGAFLNQTQDVAKKLQMVRSAWEPLCDTDVLSDGVHPTSNFRITQIMRRNPIISAAMGCAVKTARPRHGCTLDGQTKELY